MFCKKLFFFWKNSHTTYLPTYPPTYQKIVRKLCYTTIVVKTTPHAKYIYLTNYTAAPLEKL